MGKITGKKLERNIKLYFFNSDIFLSLQGAGRLIVIRDQYKTT
jgi:hypothetical protein